MISCFFVFKIILHFKNARFPRFTIEIQYYFALTLTRCFSLQQHCGHLPKCVLMHNIAEQTGAFNLLQIRNVRHYHWPRVIGRISGNSSVDNSGSHTKIFPWLRFTPKEKSIKVIITKFVSGRSKEPYAAKTILFLLCILSNLTWYIRPREENERK